MGNVLTEATTLKCGPTALGTPHGGKVNATVAELLSVEGKKVLVVGSSGSWPIQTGTCGDTTGNQTPCTQVSTITGTASKLTVNGQRVALHGVSGVTNGAPIGTIVESGTDSTLLRAE